MTYPDPHYDEDGTCPCPDHEDMRQAERDAEEFPLVTRLIRQVLEGGI